MPNVCIVAFANGQVDTRDADEWPDFKEIQEAVGGHFAVVRSPYKLEFDESWGDEAGEQETVVYCNEDGLLKGLPVNLTSLAATINRERVGQSPLVGDLMIVSGSPAFMSKR